MAQVDILGMRYLYQQCEEKPWIVCLRRPPGVGRLTYYCIVCDRFDEHDMNSIEDLRELRSNHWTSEYGSFHERALERYSPKDFLIKRVERNEELFFSHRGIWVDRLLKQDVPWIVASKMMIKVAKGLGYPSTLIIALTTAQNRTMKDPRNDETSWSPWKRWHGAPCSGRFGPTAGTPSAPQDSQLA